MNVSRTAARKRRADHGEAVQGEKDDVCSRVSAVRRKRQRVLEAHEDGRQPADRDEHASSGHADQSEHAKHLHGAQEADRWLRHEQFLPMPSLQKRVPRLKRLDHQ